MTGKDTKAEELASDIRVGKAAGETNSTIGERCGLSKGQVEQRINRQNRKERMAAAGYVHFLEALLDYLYFIAFRVSRFGCKRNAQIHISAHR